LEAVRDQILDFACAKHDFRLETDNFLPEGDWEGVFTVKFRDNPDEDRLYCKIPFGEHFLRFGLDVEIDGKIWDRENGNLIREASEYDVAVYLSPGKGVDGRRHCRLYSRAWIPNFSQRIFGLTLSNLMDCKDAVLSISRI